MKYCTTNKAFYKSCEILQITEIIEYFLLTFQIREGFFRRQWYFIVSFLQYCYEKFISSN